MKGSSLKKLKVLYIGGCGRSGSTLLGDILGSTNGFFFAGELNLCWEANIKLGRTCECGLSIAECQVWGAIFEQAFGDLKKLDIDRMYQAWKTNVRHRYLLQIITGKSQDRQYYMEMLNQLYSAIGEKFRPQILVDSSKVPTYLFNLSALSIIELYVVHMVRDPRGVAYSWRRTKINPDTGKPMPKLSIYRSSADWLALNGLTAFLSKMRKCKYMRLHYEDFVLRPRDVSLQILDFVGIGEKELPFVDEHTFRISAGHTLIGNPSRFQRGNVRIALDTKWRSNIDKKERWIISMLTLPMMLHYNYPLFNDLWKGKR
jgi:hypothetical protein